MDRATVEYVARLSRIALSEEEKALFGDQLSRIIEYVEQLNRLDTSSVAPLAQAVPIPNALREDRVWQSLEPDEALRNAPQRGGDFYKVPAVLE
jgi:aspartyl-tRNA(Asn)/glutamyl-tRNA(Gln) amidotransferase subunit C